MEEKISTLLRVVGNQSVMLHALKEKVQSIAYFRDPQDDHGTQIYEIVSGLKEWADECDSELGGP